MARNRRNNGFTERIDVREPETEELVALARRRISPEMRGAVEQEIFRRLYEPMVNWIAAKVPGLTVEDAEEIVADVLCRLMQCPSRYDPTRGTVKTFVWICVMRKSLNALRDSTRGAQMISLNEVDAVLDGRLGAGSEEGSDARVVDRTAVRQVTEILRKLPRMTRFVLDLHAKGLNNREIAARAKSTEAAVRSALSRGLRRLRREIDAAESGGRHDTEPRITTRRKAKRGNH